ncbi:hypothetical protein AgCh_027491 [Apium graveolens]
MLDASLSPDKEPLPDCRTSDRKLLGAKCMILQSLPTRTPVDYRDRAPKAHTRFHLTSPMRTPIDYRRRSSVQAYPWRPNGNGSFSKPEPEKEEMKSSTKDMIVTAVTVAGAVAAVAGVAWSVLSLFSSESSDESDDRKIMKAPGKNGATMYRDDFASDPKSYFRDLRRKS